MSRTNSMICASRRETAWRPWLGIVPANTAFGSMIDGACFVWRENDAYEVEIVDYH